MVYWIEPSICGQSGIFSITELACCLVFYKGPGHPAWNHCLGSGRDFREWRCGSNSRSWQASVNGALINQMIQLEILSQRSCMGGLSYSLNSVLHRFTFFWLGEGGAVSAWTLLWVFPSTENGSVKCLINWDQHVSKHFGVSTLSSVLHWPQLSVNFWALINWAFFFFFCTLLQDPQYLWVTWTI